MSNRTPLDAPAAESGPAPEWRAAMEGFLAAQNRQDAEAALAYVHGKSPVYESSRQLLNHVYVNYRLDSLLLESHVVGADADYGYLRVAQKTSRLDGPPFTDHTSEMLVVLAREEGVWKIWAQTILSVRPLRKAADGRRL